MKPNRASEHLKRISETIVGWAKRARGAAIIVWKKAGFYIALAGCVALIGGAAYSIRSRPPIVPEDRPMATAQPVGAQPDFIETLEQAMATPTPLIYRWPVERREILTGHSPDTPLWSATLFQWQPHTGIDIAASLGEAVVAVADGTVLRAYKDPLLGNIVELSHKDGTVTRYAALMTLDVAAMGENVLAGQPIGAVGTSAASESAMDPHLHFEAYRDGVWVDVLPGM